MSKHGEIAGLMVQVAPNIKAEMSTNESILTPCGVRYVGKLRPKLGGADILGAKLILQVVREAMPPVLGMCKKKQLLRG